MNQYEQEDDMIVQVRVRVLGPYYNRGSLPDQKQGWTCTHTSRGTSTVE